MARCGCGSRCRSRCGSKCGSRGQIALYCCLLIVAAAGGIGLGAYLRGIPAAHRPRALLYLWLPGELVGRAAACLAGPLVVAALAAGAAGSGAGRAGVLAALYCVGAACLAVMQAVGFMYAVRPGSDGLPAPPPHTSHGPVTHRPINQHIDSLLDALRDLVPNHIVKSTFEKAYTVISYRNTSDPQTEQFSASPVDGGAGAVGVAAVALVVGAVAGRVAAPHGRLLRRLLTAMCAAIQGAATMLCWLYPVWVFFALLRTILLVDDPITHIRQSFLFLLTVLLGLFTHAVLVLPVLHLATTRTNPFKLMLHCARALVTALATGSSIMTLPMTLTCLETAGVPARGTRLVAPLGSGVHAPGTMIYHTMALLLLCTSRGLPLTAATVTIIAVGAIGVSLAGPVVGGRVALLAVVGTALGLGAEDGGVLLLLPAHWALTPFCALVDVWADCVGAAVVARLSRHRPTLEHDFTPAHQGDSDTDIPLKELSPEGAVLTRYIKKPGTVDWTVKLVNETGDRLVVSKV